MSFETILYPIFIIFISFYFIILFYHIYLSFYQNQNQINIINQNQQKSNKKSNKNDQFFIKNHINFELNIFKKMRFFNMRFNNNYFLKIWLIILFMVKYLINIILISFFIIFHHLNIILSLFIHYYIFFIYFLLDDISLIWVFWIFEPILKFWEMSWGNQLNPTKSNSLIITSKYQISHQKSHHIFINVISHSECSLRCDFILFYFNLDIVG